MEIPCKEFVGSGFLPKIPLYYFFLRKKNNEMIFVKNFHLNTLVFHYEILFKWPIPY